MKKGFTLIELMLSIVIAGMLSAGLFAAITQIGSIRDTIANISSTFGRAALFQQQVERDISGAFVPAQYDLLPTMTDKKTEQQKPLENIFVGESKGGSGRLDVLTFITSNPLEIFFGIKDVKLQPRIARVVYRLEEDPKRKNSYILYRQEGTQNLRFEAYKKDVTGQMRAFSLIEGIKSLSVSYIFIEQKEDKQNKKIIYTYKVVSNWKDVEKKDIPKQAKPGEKSQRPYPKLPHFVELKLGLWDSTFVNSKEFTFTIPIASKIGQFEQPPEEKKEDDKAKQATEEEGGEKNTASAGEKNETT